MCLHTVSPMRSALLTMCPGFPTHARQKRGNARELCKESARIPKNVAWHGGCFFGGRGTLNTASRPAAPAFRWGHKPRLFTLPKAAGRVVDLPALSCTASTIANGVRVATTDLWLGLFCFLEVVCNATLSFNLAGLRAGAARPLDREHRDGCLRHRRRHRGSLDGELSRQRGSIRRGDRSRPPGLGSNGPDDGTSVERPRRSLHGNRPAPRS